MNIGQPVPAGLIVPHVFPLGTAFTDNEGDVWMIDSYTANRAATLISPETRAMPAARVERKFGPLILAFVPGWPTPTQVVREVLKLDPSNGEVAEVRRIEQTSEKSGNALIAAIIKAIAEERLARVQSNDHIAPKS